MPIVPSHNDFRRVARFLTGGCALLALAACSNDDPFRTPAQTTNVVRTSSVYAFSGGPPGLPAAIDLVNQRVVRPEVGFSGTVNFQLAFVLDGDGRLTLDAARRVTAPPGGAPQVNVQRASAAFSLIERAPDRGYVADTSFVAAVGDTWIVELPNAGCVFGNPLYAKVTLDSVFVAERRIVFSSLVNRNCGYRALTVGLPDN